MIRHIRLALGVTVLALAVVGTASPVRAATMSWGVDVFGAYNTHAMGDWNDAIDQANQSGSTYDEVKSGFSFGAGPQVVVNEQWLFAAHYEWLMPKTTKDATTDEELNTSGNAINFTAGYLFPSSSPFRMGLAAGAGYYMQSGSISDPTTSEDLSGSGIGFHVLAMGNYSFTPVVSGMMNLGYRHAPIELSEVGGQDASALNYDTDYSGMTARVGLNFHSAAK